MANTIKTTSSNSNQIKLLTCTAQSKSKDLEAKMSSQAIIPHNNKGNSALSKQSKPVLS